MCETGRAGHGGLRPWRPRNVAMRQPPPNLAVGSDLIGAAVEELVRHEAYVGTVAEQANEVLKKQSLPIRADADQAFAGELDDDWSFVSELSENRCAHIRDKLEHGSAPHIAKRVESQVIKRDVVKIESKFHHNAMKQDAHNRWKGRLSIDGTKDDSRKTSLSLAKRVTKLNAKTARQHGEGNSDDESDPEHPWDGPDDPDVSSSDDDRLVFSSAEGIRLMHKRKVKKLHNKQRLAAQSQGRNTFDDLRASRDVPEAVIAAEEARLSDCTLDVWLAFHHFLQYTILAFEGNKFEQVSGDRDMKQRRLQLDAVSRANMLAGRTGRSIPARDMLMMKAVAFVALFEEAIFSRMHNIDGAMEDLYGTNQHLARRRIEIRKLRTTELDMMPE